MNFRIFRKYRGDERSIWKKNDHIFISLNKIKSVQHALKIVRIHEYARNSVNYPIHLIWFMVYF